MFSGLAKLGNMLRKQNLCPGSKNVFDLKEKNIFLFPSSKICFCNIVSRAAKLGNICLFNYVSATTFPSLARASGEETGTVEQST